jgi:threonine aldolase
VLEPAAARARVRGSRYGVPTSAIAVEQTHNRAGGAVQPLEVLEGLRALADEAGLHLHCDGARIWNASVATGVPLERYGRLFDSLSVCFSKALGAPVGSAVVGRRDLVDRAREVRHLYGGAMRQAGVLAAAALVALEEQVDRLADDHANARLLADELLRGDDIEIDLGTVQTNIVVFELVERRGVPDASTFVERCRERGVLLNAFGPRTVRAVTHLDVAAEDCRAAATVMRAVADGR